MHLQALEDAFLAIDGRITTEEVIKELVQISGRPAEEPPSEKVAEEDDRKCSFVNPLTARGKTDCLHKRTKFQQGLL